MGMDVHGLAPTSEAGEYFRNNVWWWRPLADYIIDVAPDVARKCEHWQSNDGDGLNAADARTLAGILDAKIAEGHTEAYAVIRDAEQNAMPDDPCRICAGTGKRLEPPNVGAGTMPCNGCQATGRVRPWETSYPFSVKNVQEFIAFLRDCGGFTID